MKVHGNRPNAGIESQLDVNRTAGANAAEQKRLQKTTGTESAAGDTVQLSSAAKLAAAATAAAQNAPDIRPDKVARAKQRLANGDLGADATKLADSMIDSMLEE